MESCKLRINRGITHIGKPTSLLGFECTALEDGVIYKTPGATFELGLVSVEKVDVQTGEVFILSTVELFMNLSYHEFACQANSTNGGVLDIVLVFPSLERKTTVIPYYKISTRNKSDELIMTEPYQIRNGVVEWTEPADVYKNAFEGVYAKRIEYNDTIEQCESRSEREVQAAMYYVLLAMLRQDISNVSKNIVATDNKM